MKKITLTQPEVNHLREFYQAELEKAKTRIATLTSVLSKLGEVTPSQEAEINKLLGEKVTSLKKQTKTVVKKPGRRGRPPKAKVELPAATIADKATKTGKAVKTKTAVKATPKAKVVKPKSKTVKVVADSQQKPAAKMVAKKKVTSKRKPLKKGRGSNKMKWNEVVVDVIKNSNTLLDSNSIAQKAAEKLKLSDSDFNRVKSSVATTLTKLAKTDKKLFVHKKPGSRAGYYALPQWQTDSGELLPEYKEKLS